MNVTVDMKEILREAQELPEELASLNEVAPALRQYYSESEGRIRIDSSRRKELVEHLTDLVERGRLEVENHKLRDEQNRRLVVDTVRPLLERTVKPELLSAAVVAFMSQHRFGIRDGKVIVVGKLGTSDAEMAAVNWIEDEGRAFTPGSGTTQAPGSFAAEIEKLSNLH